MHLRKILDGPNLNYVVVSGTIHNLPDVPRYTPRPLVTFDLSCYRRRKSVDEKWVIDEMRMVLFDDEDFLRNAKEGERFKFIGEMQSRNYTVPHPNLDETIQYAVEAYHEIEGKLPTEIEPIGKKKEPIDWRLLDKYNLIPEFPEDSMYDRDMNKNKRPEKNYVYLVNEDGVVTKESQHVRYEILIKSYEKLDEPLHELKGDINKVEMKGRVTNTPFFNLLGKGIPFVNFNIGTKSEILEGYMFFNNAIAWGNRAVFIFENVKQNHFVHIKGRLQSHRYTKTLRMKKETASGKIRTKKKDIELLTHEISLSYIKIIPIKGQEIPDKKTEGKE